MKEFLIQENDADQRVDKFILKTMKTMPKSLMYKYIRNKKIKVNHKRCEISQRLVVGDVMQCYIAEEFYEVERNQNFLHVSEHLVVLYEDEAVLIVDKPSGLLAHSDTSEVEDNLADRILHYLYNRGEYDPSTEQSFTPALCHRIDRNTRGIVIAAKTASALREMNEHIRSREVIKKYVCIVEGTLKEESNHVLLYHKKLNDNKADVVAYQKDGYKEMESMYRVIAEKKNVSLVEVELMSGRSHQIRAMMSYLGAPLVGDVKYGAKKNHRQDYQQLCAYQVSFEFEEACDLMYLNHKVITLEHVDVVQYFNSLG